MKTKEQIQQDRNDQAEAVFNSAKRLIKEMQNAKSHNGYLCFNLSAISDMKVLKEDIIEALEGMK